MVSIHANAVSHDTRTISGIETFYVKKAQDVDAAVVQHVLRVLARQGQRPWWARMPGLVQRQAAYKWIVTTREKSRRLAQFVQTRVSKAAVGENRGVKARNMVVLRKSLCPACLVEVGFISNPVDAKRLRGNAYKNSIARAIALGIIDSLGSP